jgi:hypothetical protein
MTTYIVEAWHPDTSDGGAATSARLMLRTYDPDRSANPNNSGHKWRHKTYTNRGFDYSLGHSGNREQAVRYAVRVAIQQDPITINYGGETARGYLYIVEVTD